jgi:3',5'-nucleoside bisphosphate phosphatase
MKANLHLHSRYSDGTLWPDEIVERAKALGLEYLALTDHDTLGGTEEFVEAAGNAGIASCVAVEIDCEEPSMGYRSELLAYFPSSKPDEVRTLLERVDARRRDAMRAALERAELVFGRNIPYDGFERRKTNGRRGSSRLSGFSFNKVDVFSYLKDLGCIPEKLGYPDFKRSYFDSGLLERERNVKPTCVEVIARIHEDGGFAVIPHIGHEFEDSIRTLEAKRETFEALIAYFDSVGIDGIELYHYRNQDREALNEAAGAMAERFGLFVTFGSDCHGPGSGKDTLGEFSGQFDGFPESPRKNRVERRQEWPIA